MRVTLFIFPNRYRASCMPWGKFLTNANGTKLFRTKSRIAFWVFSKLLHLTFIQNLPVIVYISDPIDEYSNNNVRYLWWNEKKELNRKVNSKDFFVCRSQSIDHNWLFIMPNFTQMRTSEPPKFNNRIVYFGEPGLSIDQFAKLFSHDEVITADQMQSKLDSVGELYIAQQQELFRFLALKLLSDKFRNIDIYGTGWKPYFSVALRSNYSEKYRKQAYRGNICLDFGSKSGIGCMYTRSMDILLNFGILLHRRQIDSLDIFGPKYCSYFAFDNYSDMQMKLERLTEHTDLVNLHHDLLMRTPLAKKNVKFKQERYKTFVI